MNKFSSEKEKMFAGELYNTRDGELIEMYHRTQRLLASFRNCQSDDYKKKNDLLKEIFGSVGEGVWVEAPFCCDYGKHISIGDNSFINFNCVFLDSNKITIGNNVLIAPSVQIYTAFHPVKSSERIKSNWDAQKEPIYRTRALPVKIGDNCWIGGNCVIMPGVTIGENTTIGANSLVTKDIPSNVLAFGNPCKVIKKLE